MSDRVLHLNLKGCYFDAIRDGSKPKEYRLADTWEKRLTGKTFAAVHLMRGYPQRDDTGRHLLREWKGFTIETIQHPHFGPAPVRVCAIDVSQPHEPPQKAVPKPSPFVMTTTETPPNPNSQTGSIPVRATTETKAGVDSPPLPQSDLAPPPPSETETSPQSSPIAERAGPTVKRHKSNQGYATPWNFVRACEAKFSVRVLWDLAANDANTKAPYWISQEQDSLTKGWGRLIHSRADVFWLNPPFDDIAPWAEKCALEAALGARILLLTPASIGSNWFRDHIMGKAMVFALNGRIQFVGASDPYPKDLMLSVFGIGVPSFHIWTLPKDARA